MIVYRGDYCRYCGRYRRACGREHTAANVGDWSRDWAGRELPADQLAELKQTLDAH